MLKHKPDIVELYAFNYNRCARSTYQLRRAFKYCLGQKVNLGVKKVAKGMHVKTACHTQRTIKQLCAIYQSLFSERG